MWSRQAPLQRLVDEAAYLSHAHRSSRSPSPSHTLAPLHLDDTTQSPFASTSRAPPYFPLSLPRMFGYLPTPRGLLTTHHPQPEVQTVGVLRRGKRKVMPLEVKAFPDNVRFIQADWVNEEIPDDRDGYDVILACVPLSLSFLCVLSLERALTRTPNLADSRSPSGSTSARSTSASSPSSAGASTRSCPAAASSSSRSRSARTRARHARLTSRTCRTTTRGSSRAPTRGGAPRRATLSGS